MASKNYYQKPQAPAPKKVAYVKPKAPRTKADYAKPTGKPAKSVVTIDNANY